MQPTMHVVKKAEVEAGSARFARAPDRCGAASQDILDRGRCNSSAYPVGSAVNWI